MTTVTIFTDGLADPNSRASHILRELAHGVDRSHLFRAMPVMGYGGDDNVGELIDGRGDFAVLNSDIFAYLALINAEHNVRRKLRWVTRLFSQRIFLFARGEVTAFDQLAGKKVAMLGPESTTGITLHTLLGLARIPAAFMELEEKTPLDVDGILVLEGDLERWLPRLKAAGGFRLIPLTSDNTGIGRVYRPATISAKDAPGFLEGADIPTLKLETILAVTNLDTDNQRYARITKFTEGFVGMLPRLRKRFPGSVWDRFDFEAPVPGWQRFVPAAAIKSAAAPLGQEVRAEDVAAGALVRDADRDAARFRLAIAPSPPLAGQTLRIGGLVAELSMAVLKEALAEDGKRLTTDWTADRASLVAFVLEGEAGFAAPFETPACNDDESPSTIAPILCESALLSEPLLELPYRLLTRAESSFRLDSEEDASGKVLCMPATHEPPAFTKAQWHWVDEKELGLATAPTIDDCVSMVERKEADGVLVSEAEGLSALARTGAAKALSLGAKPVAMRGIHIAIPRTPEGKALLPQVNEAITVLKKNGRHAEILAKHKAELGDGNKAR